MSTSDKPSSKRHRKAAKPPEATIDKPSKTSSGTKSKSPRVPTSRPGSFLRRIDLRFPWLKLAILLLISTIAVLDLCDLTISRTGEMASLATVAPMLHHIRITKRDPVGKKLVALTFDDGPSATTTPTLLDTLYKEDVPVTFFVLGNMARANPDIVKRAASEEHVIASHTMYHQNLVRLKAPEVESDINEAKSVLESITGTAPTLTRPPYGSINDYVRTYAGTPLILWSVDTLDWKSKDPAAILATTMEQVHDGAIILMHDVHPTSVEAVPTLITSLRDAGYEFVTVPELAKYRNTEMINGTSYYNFTP